MKKTDIFEIPYPDKSDSAYEAPLHIQAIAERTEQLLLMMEYRIKELEQQIVDLKAKS